MAGENEDGSRIDALERRLRDVEDQLAIYRLLAAYGPAVDSRTEAATAGLWTETGRYDYGGAPLVGAQAIGDLVNVQPHVGYVERGCAHVIGMPFVAVEGDRATATGYSRVYLHDGDGWKVERTSANRWELERTQSGWKVANRVNRLLDGSPDGRELLSRAFVQSNGEETDVVS